ncbi:MAG: tetraacyldisaccharide 4'-kinase [Ignavibacteriales bacterium]|nr:MAG: tetraacyldisaccharide 4'-kinase [Ignavibacteriales bacterium]
MALLRFILFPFVPVYRWIISLRNMMFNKGLFKTNAVNAKVVSVGNIVMGGSGKTPAVINITSILKSAGLNVGVLSRGYARKSKGFKLVSDGKDIKCNVTECGDEIILTAMECKVPAAACESRVEGANKLIDSTGVKAIVLDDAFQHRWIKRDLDILIFDQMFLNKPGGMDQNLIPTGLMREPFSSVNRADAIIINRKFSEFSSLPSVLLPYFEGKQVFNGYYKIVGIFDVKSHKFYDVNEFKGQKSLVVSGIARPASFINALKKCNIDVTNQLIFKDHKHYHDKEIQLIRKQFYMTNSHSVLTTAKDAVKLTEFSKELDDIDIYYLKIELALDNNDEFEKFILNKLGVSN